MGRKAALLLIAVVVVLILLGGTALALTYTASKKASLKLNKANGVATALTTLASNATGAALTLQTDNTDPTATPLSLDTETASQAPMKVDSETKVDNLNADKLDGLDADQVRGARAYARVDEHEGSGNIPTLDISRSSGFTAVNSPVTGTYCLTPASGIDESTLPGVVSVDWSTTADPVGNASAMYQPGGAPNCLDNQFKVTTERQSIVGGALVSAPDNDIGFTIVVP
jgi:hypothetical protein